MALVPPSLPPFLADMFDMKPVAGVPSDEEVKVVHAAMRALDEVANMPRLYDAGLAMRLSQHLFCLQMARYRDRYPCTIFPTNTTYNPPPLPGHIPIALEPIIGLPSDKHTQAVQAALRLSEGLANVPSMFDADLSMNLSQHLFDIQFERYLRQVSGDDRSTRITECRGEQSDLNESDGENNDIYELQEHSNDTEGGGQNDPRVSTSEPTLPTPSYEPPRQRRRSFIPSSRSIAQNTTERTGPPGSERGQNRAEYVKTGFEDTNKLLVKLGNGLEDVKRILIGTQHSMARGFNATIHDGKWGSMRYAHTYINEMGKDPSRVGLPTPGGISDISDWGSERDALLVQYLRFYGIGKGLIEEGDEPKVKEGKRGEAKSQLRQYLSI